MFPTLSHNYSHSLPEMPPPDLLFLSLSTAAWIAALSAAIGLCRLKSLGSRSHSTSTPPPPPAVVPTELAKPATSPAAAAPAPAPAPAPARPVETCRAAEGGALGSPRSRFVMTYACDDDGVDECRVEEEKSGEGEVTSTWEVTGPRWMGVRGDLGWYRYQDRAAIDGSVVRLWDFNGGFTGGPRRGLSLMSGVERAISI